MSKFVFFLRLTAIVFFIAVFHSTFRLMFDEFADVEFSRLGLITDTTATILIRYPPPVGFTAASMELYLYYKSSRLGESSSVATKVSAESDWTGQVVLKDLQPDTKYRYYWHWVNGGTEKNLIEFNDMGRRDAKPLFGSKKNDGLTLFDFKTSPKEGSNIKFSFAFGKFFHF